ncbi:TPA: hypothetical protein OQU49_004424 [Shigella flexneri]|nr:hypothetical protein [Shigella flexneri]
MSVDDSELRRFGADLGKAATEAASVKGLDPIVKRAAQGLKDDYVGQAEGSRSFKGMAGSFSYDSFYEVGQVQYEVGPDKGRRGGALGNVFFFGGANGGGGSGDLEGPIEKQGGRMMSALDSYLGGIL